METEANGTEISRKSFPKFRKLLNFRNANHSTENSRNSASKVEWKENFRENLGIPREVVPFFLEILENAVPFATGSCQKFKPEVLDECKAPKILPQKKRSVWSLRYYLQTKMSIQITTKI